MEILPPEILEVIFKNLSSLRDITNCFKTCARWNQVIKEIYRNNGMNSNRV